MSPNESPAPPAGLDCWRVFNERFADLAARGVEPELARLEAFDRAFDEWLNRSFDLVDAATDPNSCRHCGKAGDAALLAITPNAHGWHAWEHYDSACVGDTSHPRREEERSE
jgi:hypothetical protein